MAGPPTKHQTGPRRTVSPTSAGRFAARARNRWRLALRAVLSGLIALTLLCGAAWVLLESGWAAVRHVQVTGLDRLGRGQVLDSAGIVVGEPLVLLDSDEVARRITTSLRAARTVRVSRGWPRTVRIEVHERVAVVGVRVSGGVRVLDRDGVAFALDARLPAGVIPVLASAQGAAMAGGPVPAEDAGMAGRIGAEGRQAVSNAAVVVAALPPGVREQVEQVTAHSPDAIELELRDGRTVHWGGPDRSARKALVLQALMRHSADAYDVSAPNAPTTRG